MPRLALAATLSLIAFGAVASEAAAKGSKLRVEDHPRYGKIVTNGSGKALYLFTKEDSPAVECFDICAEAWPPYLTSGKPVAGKGINRRHLGSTPRPDGTRQVTYRGHPLYFYVHDTRDKILCQDVFEFGGTWLLVDPKGRAVR